MTTTKIDSDFMDLIRAVAPSGRVVEHYAGEEDGIECAVVSERMPADFPSVVMRDGTVLSFGSGSMGLAKKVARAFSEGMVTVDRWRPERRWRFYG